MIFKFNNQAKSKNKVKSLVERSFLGMSKKEVVDLLGIGKNCYGFDVWYYEINKTWWQMKTVVFICFENDIVEFKTIQFIYGRIKTNHL